MWSIIREFLNGLNTELQSIIEDAVTRQEKLNDHHSRLEVLEMKVREIRDRVEARERARAQTEKVERVREPLS